MTYQTIDAVKCPIFGAPKPLPENQLLIYLRRFYIKKHFKV